MADTSSTTGLNSLIAQYGTDSAKIKAGVTTDSDSSSSSSSTDNSLANQNVFMELYIAQLKNQDPTAPQETGDMVSQMAEFSSLEQLTAMSSSMKTMSESLLSSQALSASSLVGKYVYAEQNTGTIDSDTSSIDVKVTIPSDSTKTSLKVYDSDGKLVDTVSIDSDGKATWDGKDSSGNTVDNGDYTFVATSTNVSGETTSLTTSIPSRINGVTLNGSDGATLNVAGYGTLKLSDNLEIVG